MQSAKNIALPGGGEQDAIAFFPQRLFSSHPESAGISPRRPEISRRASAHREVESAIMDTFIPMSLAWEKKNGMIHDKKTDTIRK